MQIGHSYVLSMYFINFSINFSFINYTCFFKCYMVVSQSIKAKLDFIANFARMLITVVHKSYMNMFFLTIRHQMDQMLLLLENLVRSHQQWPLLVETVLYKDMIWMAMKTSGQ